MQLYFLSIYTYVYNPMMPSINNCPRKTLKNIKIKHLTSKQLVQEIVLEISDT